MAIMLGMGAITTTMRELIMDLTGMAPHPLKRRLTSCQGTDRYMGAWVPTVGITATDMDMDTDHRACTRDRMDRDMARLPACLQTGTDQDMCRTDLLLPSSRQLQHTECTAIKIFRGAHGLEQTSLLSHRERILMQKDNWEHSEIEELYLARIANLLELWMTASCGLSTEST